MKPRLHRRADETVDQMIDRWRAENLLREVRSWTGALAASCWDDEDARAEEKQEPSK